LKDALTTLSAAIQLAHANKVLPPPFSSESLRGLLKDAICVCGRDLKADSDACQHIEKVIEEFHTLSEVGLELSKLQVPLYSVVSNSKRAADEVNSISERIKQALADEVSANEQYEILRKKLAGNDDEAVSLLSRNLDKYQDDFANTQQEIGRLETQEAHFVSEVEKVRREIENQVTADKQAQFAVSKAKFAKDALRVAEELYANLSDQVRAQVAQTLDEEFQSMIWKKDFFMPVEVDEHYRVQVRNKKGFEVREALSAGETACLAFAFSLTLSKVAGFFYPMVVDSPFGRLDAEVREFVSVVLARVLKSSADDSGNQLIMLMTDGEYTESVSQVMSESDPLLFELEFDLLSGESTVLSLDN
jgi:DNA sulfur modification protein DndD